VKTRAILFFALTVLVPVSVGAQMPSSVREAPTDRRFSEATGEAREVIRAFMVEHNVPGVSVAVGVDGQVAWSEGFGFADLENRVLVTPLTKFRIGSVSKTLTADALAILLDEGRVDLDVPVQTYVRSFPEKRWPVTVRQMGGHLSGIRHYRGTESYSEGQRRYSNVNTSLRIFRADTLLFEPGTQYSYSSYAWNLISAVIQSAEGEPFLEFIDRKVFEPLGMRNTVAEHTDSIIPFRTRYYSNRGGVTRNAPFVDNSYKWAGGGFLSNTEDLITFGYAHFDYDYISEETVELFWTSQQTSDGDDTRYGIGWGVYADDAGRRIVGHGGSSIGGRTQFIMYRDLGVIVAVTANLSEAPVSSAFAQAIAAGFLEGRNE
jgi:serine beta-lactamase-like protein LACTB